MDKSLNRRPSRRPPPAPPRRPASDPHYTEGFAPGPAWRALTEHLELGALLEDRAGRIHWANRQFCHLFGLSPAPADLAGMPARTAARRAAQQLREPAAFMDWIDRVLHRRQAVEPVEFERRDGRVIALGYTPVNEGVLANLWQCRDVTAERKTEARLRALAQTDELTGLPNRRQVLDTLGREMERDRRSGATASVLMLDVDGFKQINDARGHASGDGVLCELAAVLARRCRSADTAARLGGDEFLVILPDTGREGCCEIAERLLRELRANRDSGLSVSIGATTLAAGDTDVDAVLARVDRALYGAKDQGRDCMCYLDADAEASAATRVGGSSGLRPVS